MVAPAPTDASVLQARLRGANDSTAVGGVLSPRVRPTSSQPTTSGGVPGDVEIVGLLPACHRAPFETLHVGAAALLASYDGAGDNRLGERADVGKWTHP